MFGRMRRRSDVFLLLRIFCFATAVPLLVRLNLPTLEALLRPRRNPLGYEPANCEKVISYVECVLRLGRPLVRPGCLSRGLTLYYFLIRTGVNVGLCFGVGKVKGKFAGHCWLVRNGEPFLERTDPRPLFTEVYRFNRELSTSAGAPAIGPEPVSTL